MAELINYSWHVKGNGRPPPEVNLEDPFDVLTDTLHVLGRLHATLEAHISLAIGYVHVAWSMLYWDKLHPSLALALHLLPICETSMGRQVLGKQQQSQESCCTTPSSCKGGAERDSTEVFLLVIDHSRLVAPRRQWPTLCTPVVRRRPGVGAEDAQRRIRRFTAPLDADVDARRHHSTLDLMWLECIVFDLGWSDDVVLPPWCGLRASSGGVVL